MTVTWKLNWVLIGIEYIVSRTQLLQSEHVSRWGWYNKAGQKNQTLLKVHWTFLTRTWASDYFKVKQCGFLARDNQEFTLSLLWQQQIFSCFSHCSITVPLVIQSSQAVTGISRLRGGIKKHPLVLLVLNYYFLQPISSLVLAVNHNTEVWSRVMILVNHYWEITISHCSKCSACIVFAFSYFTLWTEYHFYSLY